MNLLLNLYKFCKDTEKLGKQAELFSYNENIRVSVK